MDHVPGDSVAAGASAGGTTAADRREDGRFYNRSLPIPSYSSAQLAILASISPSRTKHIHSIAHEALALTRRFASGSGRPIFRISTNTSKQSAGHGSS